MVKKEIKIQNIVASTSLEHDIPLIKLAEALPNTEYNPEQFPGLVMRIRDPKKSIENIIKNVEKIGIKIKVKPIIKVQNMVASGAIGMDLNLNDLAMKLENTEYEPEQFPGLVYKLDGTRATFYRLSQEI